MRKIKNIEKTHVKKWENTKGLLKKPMLRNGKNIKIYWEVLWAQKTHKKY